MKRGRPPKTKIRENIAAILARVGQSYGYKIYKFYKIVFGDISLRNLYYNIKKGHDLGEFIIIDVKRESGSYTWGGEVQHIYYTLGPYSKMAEITQKQRHLLSKLPLNEVEIDFEKEVNKKIEELKQDIDKFKKEESRLKYEERTKFKSWTKQRAELLKDWIRSKFDKQKAHEIRVKIDETANKVY